MNLLGVQSVNLFRSILFTHTIHTCISVSHGSKLLPKKLRLVTTFKKLIEEESSQVIVSDFPPRQMKYRPLQCPMKNHRPLQCLILPVSGASVSRDTTLITLPLLLRPDFEKPGFSLFFLVGWGPLETPGSLLE